ncbi:hypothetical protein AOLI_G00032880 [Acnodon oligacanthus]
MEESSVKVEVIHGLESQSNRCDFLPSAPFDLRQTVPKDSKLYLICLSQECNASLGGVTHLLPNHWPEGVLLIAVDSLMREQGKE